MRSPRLAQADEEGPVMVTVPIPRSALTLTQARPLLATNANCEAVLGVTRRAFLAWLPELEAAGVKVIRRGKLRACLLEDLERWLRARVERPATTPADDGVARLAAELGFERRAGGCR